MTDTILQPRKPYRFEARNPRPGFRVMKTGHIYTLNVEIDEASWETLKTIPANAIIENILWYGDGDDMEPEPILGTTDSPPPPSAKKKAPRGPYAEFWRIMVVKGVKTYPDLQQSLDCLPNAVWGRLHEAFEVETMSAVSPRQWEAWVEKNGLSAALITMSRNAEVQAAKVGQTA